MLINEKKRLISNFLSLGILQGTNFILPLLTLPYLVRTLETDKFGLVMFAQAFIMYFTIFIDYGFNLSATREISIVRFDTQKISELFSAIITIKLYLLLFAFLFLIAIIFSFDKFEKNWLIYILTFGMVIGQTIFPVWFFQGMEKMKYITILNIMAKLIFTIAIFVFVHKTTDYLYVPILNSFGFILAGILSLVIVFRNFNIHFIKPKKSLMIHLFKESTHLFISNISVTLFSVSNTFILGIFTNNDTVGIYASIEKVIVAIKNLYAPLYQALFPWLSQKSKKEIGVITKKMIPMIFLLGFFFFILLFIFAENILNTLYHSPVINQYASIFKLFSLISIFASLNMLFNMLYLTTIKAYKERMDIMLISGLYSIFATTLLTLSFGIHGTAFSAVTTEFLLLLLGVYHFMKKSKNG